MTIGKAPRLSRTIAARGYAKHATGNEMRSAVEAVFGHAAIDGRLGQNCLHRRECDQINELLAAAGQN